MRFTSNLSMLFIAVFCLAMPFKNDAAQYSKDKNITISGSTSVSEPMEILAEMYNKSHPDVFVQVQATSSTAGIKTTSTGASMLGMVSRKLTDAEKSNLGLSLQPLAIDGIAIVVNKANPVNSLTKKQLKLIYEGNMKNWNEVSNFNMSSVLVTRDTPSGTRTSLDEALSLVKEINGKYVSTITSKALVASSNGLMKTIIANNIHAIGYVSFGSKHPQIKNIAVDNVEPTKLNILNGSYTITRPFTIIYKEHNLTPAGRDFLKWLASDEVKNYLDQNGYIVKK